MKTRILLVLAVLPLLSGCESPGPSSPTAAYNAAGESILGTLEDPYLWLEDVSGAKAQGWVRAQNEACLQALGSSPDFEPLRQRLLGIYNSEERIPPVRKYGRFHYNFWRDEKNPRGVWHRTSLEEYRKPSPAWELVLDLDQLAAEEKENWVWKGTIMLHPAIER